MASNNLSTCTGQLAMASIPKQEWCEPYDLHTALEEGTIFPCLNLTFHKAPSGKCNCKTNCGYSAPEQNTAGQKARTVYDNLLRVIDDPDVIAPLKFLRAREIVHFQRFGEALEITKDSTLC